MTLLFSVSYQGKIGQNVAVLYINHRRNRITEHKTISNFTYPSIFAQGSVALDTYSCCTCMDVCLTACSEGTHAA